MRMTARKCTLFILMLCSLPGYAVEERVVLCTGGRAEMPIVVSAGATDSVRESARSLAKILDRMSGAAFVVEVGDGKRGIAVGRAVGFPLLNVSEEFGKDSLAEREHYLLRSHADGLLVVGATDIAVRDAVWDLLYRLGYRQFFPGEVWEVIPDRREIALSIDIDERPDYVSRRIWYGYGLWDYNASPYRLWCERNRVVQGFTLHTGHAYGRIIRHNRRVFDAHPEYRGFWDASRESSKFCIGNPELRDLVRRYALASFQTDPDRDSLSMDPSDGGAWCTCARCASLGSVTDRAVTLANTVARTVTATVPEAHIGMYAYNQHSPPPAIEVHPHVVVSIATAFIRGGYTVEDLFAGWGAKGNPLGVREYYSVVTWDRSLPGRSRGCDLAYLAKTIPAFYGFGARFLSAESSDNWGANGLGYYVASRLLWDIDEAENVDRLVDDFIEKAFGEAHAPMRRFYRLLDGAAQHPLSDDLVGRMYRRLSEAADRCREDAVRARLDDLILYTRYVELYRAYDGARGEARQHAFEELIRYAYRIRATMMVHTRGLYRDLVRRDNTVTIPEDARWNVPEDRNPWKDSTPLTKPEIGDILRRGIAANETIAFTPVTYSSDLAPAAAVLAGLPETQPAPLDVRMRHTNRLYVWVDSAEKPLTLQVTGGLIAHYRDRGNVRLDLTPEGQAFEQPVAHAEVPPDGSERTVALEATQTGLHVLRIADGGDMTRIRSAAGVRIALPARFSDEVDWQGRETFVFYVPAGAAQVGMFVAGSMDICDADGTALASFDDEPGTYAAIDVPTGQDDRFWTLSNATGRCVLLTVPPYLACSPGQLLLPADLKKRSSPHEH